MGYDMFSLPQTSQPAANAAATRYHHREVPPRFQQQKQTKHQKYSKSGEHVCGCGCVCICVWCVCACVCLNKAELVYAPVPYGGCTLWGMVPCVCVWGGGGGGL